MSIAPVTDSFVGNTKSHTHSHTAEEAFTAFEYHKQSRLSHEELLIPLVYWSNVPKHTITAMLVHKSLRFGQLLVTASISGEFIIWKSKSHFLSEDETDDIEPHSHNDKMQWIAVAMTLSTNATQIKTILGLSLYNSDQTCFTALHCDGEMEIFSVLGSGALKVCRSDSPIIPNSNNGAIK